MEKKKFVLKRETLLDKAMRSYATKLVQGNVGLESQPRGEPGTSPAYLRMSSIPRLKAGGSNHQLYKGKGLNKVRSSTSSVSIRESSVATKSMLIMSQSMKKARNINGFLMFDATKLQVFK